MISSPGGCLGREVASRPAAGDHQGERVRKVIAMIMLLVLGGGPLAACGTTNTDQLTATTWYLVPGGE